MSTVLIIYIAGMLSCWLGFYLHCKVTGSFATGEVILVWILLGSSLTHLFTIMH